MAKLDLLRLGGAGAGDVSAGDVSDVRAKLDRDHSVTLPARSDFEAAGAASFYFTRTVSVGDVIEWLATNSAFITAVADDRAAGLARCRAALEEQAGGASVIEMPMRSWCWRAVRSDISPGAD